MDDAQIQIERHNVDWESHSSGVDSSGRRYPQPAAGLQAFLAEQTYEPGQESVGNASTITDDDTLLAVGDFKQRQ